jgi:hypothetical protein
MLYAQARELIKSGDMLLWRDHKGGSVHSIIERWIVRHGTGSPYTHVAVAWAEHGRVWAMEITTSGCAPRLLSSLGQFDWAPSPKLLSDDALNFAFGCFGSWIYSRWQAVMGALKTLRIGDDTQGQCAEYALSIWRRDGMAPTEIATPGDCADGALLVWQASVQTVFKDTK